MQFLPKGEGPNPELELVAACSLSLLAFDDLRHGLWACGVYEPPELMLGLC